MSGVYARLGYIDRTYSAKYGLSVLARIEEHIPGVKLYGYDIGCAFRKTVANNSLLSRMWNSHLAVTALHAYSHNRACQAENHPKYIEGAGLEDLEGCERFFSSSNRCAGITRHATAFHRHQTLDAHFQHWDSQKFAALGTFILNNYKQALELIRKQPSVIQQIKSRTQGAWREGDFEKWLAEEVAYLQGLRQEPEAETLRMDYVEALDDWRQAT